MNRRIFQLFTFFLISSSALFAQDSVSVTFRYSPDNSVVRVMLPGEFNNFGPNNNGQISPTAVSLMSYNGAQNYWYKTIRLEVGGGESTNNGQAGYRYKFHEHYNASGSENAWLADPLNPDVAVEGLGDSWLKITHPMVFQLQPVNNSVFELEEPELTATVAAIDSDPISESESKIIINGVEASSFEGYYNADLQMLTVPDISELGEALNEGSNTLKIFAVTEQGASITDSTTITYIGESQTVDMPRPEGLRDGISYDEDGTSVTLSLFAPYKENVFVIGDFNDWQVDLDYQMNRDSVNTDSIYFWLKIEDLTPGEEYGFQYLVDGQIRITDPYSELVLDEFNDPYIPESVFPDLKAYPSGKTNFRVGVLTPGKAEFEWEAANYTPPEKEELIIYELLIRDFFETPGYENLTDTLDYLQNLGINAIELMPVNEFEGNNSWGYNPAFHMALDKYYGTPNAFKRFVDEAHKRGIAVILDVVLNHSFGQNPIVRLWNEGDYGNPTSQNPYFNTSARHPFNVGYDFNHESAATKYYSQRVMEYWLTEYRIDGYRFDLSKGFTQTDSGDDVGAWGNFDQSRIDIWKDYSDYIWSVNADAYVILEHFAATSEERVLTENGMMVWGNMNHEYNEATMGYNADLSGVLATSRGRGLEPGSLVGYMESHDEQWLMFKNISFGACSNAPGGGDTCETDPGDYNVRDFETAFDRMELAGAFFLLLPGPKMIWQFGELGYGYGENGEQCLNDSADCPANAPGRTDPKPIRWDYYDETGRMEIYDAWSNFLYLRQQHPAVNDSRTSSYRLSESFKIKSFSLQKDDSALVVAGNFGVTRGMEDLIFPEDGTWYDYFSDAQIEVTDLTYSVNLAPGEFRIFTNQELVPLSDENNLAAELPLEFGLKQNYPNPFNPSTNIVYDIAEAGQVTLEVFDITGRKIAELVNGFKSAGSYRTTFQAAGLSSGMYFARLKAGNSVHIQKMMLIK